MSFVSAIFAIQYKKLEPMDNIASILKILEEHYKGVWMLIFMLLAIIFVINWLARIFNLGRFRNRGETGAKVDRDRIIADFMARLINDFRHLLALVIVVIFFSLVFYSMAMSDKFEEKMDALQMVIASFVGLLGSIIGYYFGESAARRAQLTTLPSTTTEGNVPETEPIVEAPVAKGIPTTENKNEQ